MGVTFVRCGSSPTLPISICGTCLWIIGINIIFFKVEDALLSRGVVFCATVRKIWVGLEILLFECHSIDKEVYEPNVWINIELTGISGKIVNVSVEEIVIEMSRCFLQQLLLRFSNRLPVLDFFQTFWSHGICGVPDQFKTDPGGIDQVLTVVTFPLFHITNVHRVFLGADTFFDQSDNHNEYNHGRGSAEQSD